MRLWLTRRVAAVPGGQHTGSRPGPLPSMPHNARLTTLMAVERMTPSAHGPLRCWICLCSGLTRVNPVLFISPIVRAKSQDRAWRDGANGSAAAHPWERRWSTHEYCFLKRLLARSGSIACVSAWKCPAWSLWPCAARHCFFAVLAEEAEDILGEPLRYPVRTLLGHLLVNADGTYVEQYAWAMRVLGTAKQRRARTTRP